MLDRILLIAKFSGSIYLYVYAQKGEFCTFCGNSLLNGYFSSVFC